MITPFDDCPASAEWRVTSSDDDYEVSEYGHLRRRTAAVQGRWPAGRMIKPVLERTGYTQYHLWRHKKGVVIRAHRLVALAFLERPASKDLRLVAHNDGIKLNNHYSNLRWATYTDNNRDTSKHGRKPCGERSYFAKLTADQVRVIRAEASRTSQKDLAKQFGTTPANISHIIRRVSWAHIK